MNVAAFTEEDWRAWARYARDNETARRAYERDRLRGTGRLCEPKHRTLFAVLDFYRNDSSCVSTEISA